MLLVLYNMYMLTGLVGLGDGCSNEAAMDMCAGRNNCTYILNL